MDIQKFYIIAQLIDSMESVVDKLKNSYSQNNVDNFNKAKIEILNIQRKISDITENVS